MKKIEFNKMEEIQGGFAKEFCAVVGAAGYISFLAGTLTGGLAWGAAAVAGGYCAVYAFT